MSEIISRETADELQAELSFKNEEDAALEAAKGCFEDMAETRDELVARVAMAIMFQSRLAKADAFQEVLELRQPLTWGIRIMVSGYWLRCWLRVRIEGLKAELTAL